MSPNRNILVTRGLKLSHLQFVATLSQTGGIQATADQLSITQPAASRLAAEIERIIGQPIHQRAGRGIELTPSGRALANRATRALREIEDANADISEIEAGLTGDVQIGAVAGPSIEYVIPALRKVRVTMPDISISVEVETSDILVSRLAQGELDFVIGRLPQDVDSSMFIETPIASEPVCFIARGDHALMRETDISIERMLEFDWVLPFKGTILYNAIERSLRQNGLSFPTHTTHTSSFLFASALVQQTNAVSPISVAVADVFSRGQNPSLRKIDTRFNIQFEMFSFLTLAGRQFSPTTERVFQMVKSLTGTP